MIFRPVWEGFWPRRFFRPRFPGLFDSAARRRYSSGMKRRGDSALRGGIQHVVEKGNSYPSSARRFGSERRPKSSARPQTTILTSRSRPRRSMSWTYPAIIPPETISST